MIEMYCDIFAEFRKKECVKLTTYLFLRLHRVRVLSREKNEHMFNLKSPSADFVYDALRQ